MGVVKINVSGTVFDVDSKIFEKLDPDKKLAGQLPALVIKAVEDGSSLEFQRSAVSFSTILDFYQSGELHMPTDMCPASFKKELDFWQIEVSAMEICCRTKYLSFIEEQDLLKAFRKDTQKYSSPTTKENTPNIRSRTWKIVENPSATLLSKIYFVLITLAVLASITSITLGTHKHFMREATFCELLEFLEYDDPSLYDAIMESSGADDCLEPANLISHDPEKVPRDIIYDEDTWSFHVKLYPPYQNDTKPRHPEIRPIKKLFLKKDNLIAVEYVTLGFFTLDFLLRTLSCPCIWSFIRSALNIIDMAALFGSYTLIILSICFVEQKYKTNWLDVLGYIQVFRALRLFRVAKQIRTSRVLSFSVRRNIKELSVLILFLLICICTFGTLIFFAEREADIRSIPEGFWWAVVTITTLGYGDAIPQTLVGRIIGSLCAVTGIWLMSMTLPILINNFILLYKYPSETNVTHENKYEMKNGANNNGLK